MVEVALACVRQRQVARRFESGPDSRARRLPTGQGAGPAPSNWCSQPNRRIMMLLPIIILTARHADRDSILGSGLIACKIKGRGRGESEEKGARNKATGEDSSWRSFEQTICCRRRRQRPLPAFR